MAVVTLSLLTWNNEFELYCAGMLVCMCLPSKTPVPWPADHRRECTEGHRQASRQFQAIYCWRVAPLQPLQSTVCTTRHTDQPAYWCRYREPEAVHTAVQKNSNQTSWITLRGSRIVAFDEFSVAWFLAEIQPTLNHTSLLFFEQCVCGFRSSMKVCLLSCSPLSPLWQNSELCPSAEEPFIRWSYKLFDSQMSVFGY